jgi:hypothetical protein
MKSQLARQTTRGDRKARERFVAASPIDARRPIGIHGNSHMLMQDKNSLQIADWLVTWIDRHVGTTH